MRLRQVSPESVELGMLNGLCDVISRLFVYLEVNYKACVPLFPFCAPPDLLRLNDSLVCPGGVRAVTTASSIQGGFVW